MDSRTRRKNNYEIKCVRNNIISKESKGLDATFERELLKSWAKYEGWENAGKDNELGKRNR